MNSDHLQGKQMVDLVMRQVEEPLVYLSTGYKEACLVIAHDNPHHLCCFYLKGFFHNVKVLKAIIKTTISFCEV